MLERLEKPLRIVCLLLGAMVLLQVSRLALRKNPLDQLNIPELPSISTNEVGQADAKSTNAVPVPAPEKKQTNTIAGSKETNAVAVVVVETKNTNSVAQLSKNQTNTAAADATKSSNELTQAVPPGTNAVSAPTVELKNTNALAELTKNQPNAPGKVTAKDSNLVGQAASSGTNAASTNAATLNTNKIVASSAMPPGTMMPGARLPGAGKKPGALPAAIQARVDKITESELLAPVIRPAPMALFGIAGDSAFLRGPKGQTGVVKEGEEIDGVKLLKIGFNRVLVEQDGEKKELMVFSGFGGESLLPKENKETPK